MVNENVITETDIKEFENLARNKKDTIRYKTISSNIDGEYNFKIGGVGRKAIKLEMFLDYGLILKNKSNKGIEEKLYNMLMELPK